MIHTAHRRCTSGEDAIAAGKWSRRECISTTVCTIIFTTICFRCFKSLIFRSLQRMRSPSTGKVTVFRCDRSRLIRDSGHRFCAGHQFYAGAGGRAHNTPNQGLTARVGGLKVTTFMHPAGLPLAPATGMPQKVTGFTQVGRRRSPRRRSGARKVTSFTRPGRESDGRPNQATQKVTGFTRSAPGTTGPGERLR